MRLNRLTKLVESLFEGSYSKGLRVLGSSTQKVQELPKAGGEGDGRKRDNCELMARQTDQFNITGKYT
jgi:hypothetical protein